MPAQIFDSSTNTYNPLPQAEYYVVSKDTFMSGWGPAKGKSNWVVVPCATYDEAYWVEQYVKTRNDQSYISVSGTPPKANSKRLYSLCLGWLDRAAELRAKAGR